MFDLSWSELLLVGAIALVVIGPRELPRVLRTVGQTLAKVRRMAGEFQSQFNAAMREAEIDDIRNTVYDVKETASRAMNVNAGAAFKPLQAVRDELRDALEDKGADKQADATPDGYGVDPNLDIGLGEKAKISLAAVSPAPDFKLSAPLEPVSPAKFQPCETAENRQKNKRLRKAGRVIVAAPRDVVKPLARQPKGTERLYKKIKFSAFPARKRHAKQVLHAHDTKDNA